MGNNNIALKNLLIYTRDGEWGQDSPADDRVEMLVIRGTDFAAVRYGDLTEVPRRFIPQNLANNKRLLPNDILIETAGGSKGRPTGKTLLITEQILGNSPVPVTCASFCRFLRVDRTAADPEYVFWHLQHLYASGETYNYQVQHTGIARFQYTVFAENTRLSLPSFDEQREIARILGTLDDKIELNRRMNATLEATARALFQSWFVDFDPVHAKAEGRQPEGMDAETAALFPDSFEESPLGMIPRGWRVESLDRIADFQNGLALQKYPPEGNEFLPVIKIRELRQGHIDDNSDKASPNIRESCIVYDGDVLFSWSGSLIVDLWCGGTGALNQHLFKVTSKDYPKWFYLHWTKHHLEEFIGVAADKATTMGHIQRHHLSSALTVVPPDDVLGKLDVILAPLVEQVIRARLESRTLAETRDALLPKLMSGEVRVVSKVSTL